MLVPNQQLISNAVINWSYTDPRIRLKLPVRVSYATIPKWRCKCCSPPAKARRACCATRARIAPHALQRQRHRARTALLDFRPAGRREQRALRRQPRHLAAVQGNNHHHSRGAARNRHAQRACLDSTDGPRRHHAPDHHAGHRPFPTRNWNGNSFAPPVPAARTSTRSRAPYSCGSCCRKIPACRSRSEIDCAPRRGRSSSTTAPSCSSHAANAARNRTGARSRSPRRTDSRRAGRTEDPQEDPAHQGLARNGASKRRSGAAIPSGDAAGSLGNKDRAGAATTSRTPQPARSRARAAVPIGSLPQRHLQNAVPDLLRQDELRIRRHASSGSP
jgi:hypothetical protein